MSTKSKVVVCTVCGAEHTSSSSYSVHEKYFCSMKCLRTYKPSLPAPSPEKQERHMNIFNWGSPVY